jgi:hypothetical protein
MGNTYDLQPAPALPLVALLVPQMREIRDRLLAGSDWRMLPDIKNDKTAWAEYRQQLRDFPDTWVPDPIVTFPSPPTD